MAAAPAVMIAMAGARVGSRARQRDKEAALAAADSLAVVERGPVAAVPDRTRGAASQVAVAERGPISPAVEVEVPDRIRGAVSRVAAAVRGPISQPQAAEVLDRMPVADLVAISVTRRAPRSVIRRVEAPRGRILAPVTNPRLPIAWAAGGILLRPVAEGIDRVREVGVFKAVAINRQLQAGGIGRALAEPELRTITHALAGVIDLPLREAAPARALAAGELRVLAIGPAPAAAEIVLEEAGVEHSRETIGLAAA